MSAILIIKFRIPKRYSFFQYLRQFHVQRRRLSLVTCPVERASSQKEQARAREAIFLFIPTLSISFRTQKQHQQPSPGVPVTSIKIPAVDEPLFRAIVRRF